MKTLAALLMSGLICQTSLAGPKDFDFLLGEHDVSLHAWTASGWTPPRPTQAQWHGHRSLKDQVIQDEWFDPENGDGINIRYFDEAENLWKMMWISTNGRQVQDLRAELRDGVLTMWQVHPPRPGWQAQFEVLNNCRWQRIGYQENAKGELQRQFKLVATRRGCQLP